MDFSEKWGSSVDNAVELALIDLKLTKDQVEVIVLEEPSKGFFGIGSKLAKVRVEKKIEKPVEKAPKPEVAVQPKPAKQEVKPNRREFRPGKEEARPAKEEARTIRENFTGKPFFEREKESGREHVQVEYKPRNNQDKYRRESNFEGLRQEKPDNLVPVADDNKVLEFLKELTEKMGLDVKVEAQENEEMFYADIEGKDSGTIIGKRGQTLDAIQYLTSLVANKGEGKYVKVVVDAENYRQKREKTLEQLANRLASKVIKSRKSVRLEPMNPYERKVIHATLQNNPEVTTRSEGEEPYRRVIIDLK